MDAKTLSKQIKKTQKKLLKNIYDEEKTEKYVNKLRRLKIRYDNIIDIEKEEQLKREEEKQKQIADLEDLKKISDELVKEKQEREEKEREAKQQLDAHGQTVINPFITSDTIIHNMFNDEQEHKGASMKCINTKDYKLYENLRKHNIYDGYDLFQAEDITEDTELRKDDIIYYYDYNTLRVGRIIRFTNKTVFYQLIKKRTEHSYYCSFDFGQSETFHKIDYRNSEGRIMRKSKNSLYHVRNHKKVLYVNLRG